MSARPTRSRPRSTPRSSRPRASLPAGLRARRGVLAVGGAGLLSATTGLAVVVVHDRSGLGAVAIGWYRLALAALVLVAVAGPRRVGRVWAGDRGRLALAGVGLAAFQVLYFVGVQQAGVAVSTLVSLAVAPVALTVAAALRRRRMPAPRSVATVAAAVGGLALISLSSASPGAGAAHPVIGVLASAASGLVFAASTVLYGRLAADGTPLVLTAITAAVGAVVLLPVAVVTGLGLPRDAVSIGWLAWLAVVSTALAYGLLYAGLRTTPPEVAGVLSLIEPLGATLLAAAVLHERLGTAGWCGAGLLLAAVAALYVRAPDPPDSPVII